MAGDRVLYRGKAAVPGYELLSDHFKTWVPAIQEIWNCEKQLAELAAAEKEIGGMGRTRQEFSEMLIASFDGYRQRYVERLAKYLSEVVKGADPLRRVERLDFLARPLHELSAFEEALAMLPDEVFSEVPSAEKQKELSKIQKQKQKIEGRLTELRCPPYLQLVGGVLQDIREIFIGAWRQKQSEASEGCDPCGFDLRGASDDLRYAFRELEIASAVNPRGLLPALRD
jgi:hypothetical protein